MTAQPRRRSGFTLVELLVVIVILGILIGLLVPVIIGAVNRANEARVSAEINSIAQSLASFKNKYGDYPPSRIILSETGGYNVGGSPPTFYSGMPHVPPYAPIGGDTFTLADGDVNYPALVNRSIRYLRKFFPRAAFSTNTGTTAYDFNYNGIYETNPIYLTGEECLVFFLGGVPVHEGDGSDPRLGFGRIIGVEGIGKNPTNPFPLFDRNIAPPPRDQPFYDFQPSQLWDDDTDGMPGYVDTLGQGDQGRYFAYFNGYNGTGYDPNDCNYNYAATGEDVGAFGRTFVLSFPVAGGSVPAPSPAVNGRTTASPLPNPYTTGPSFPVNGTAAAFINDQSYQIISAGRDRQYGVGGRYARDSNAERLPDDAPIGTGDRIRERDNLSNFSQGALE